MWNQLGRAVRTKWAHDFNGGITHQMPQIDFGSTPILLNAQGPGQNWIFLPPSMN